MAMRLIPGAAALSEFVAGYHGDCGESAELALLHVIHPAIFPLDAAALSQIVQRDISKGWASASGSEPIGSIASDLDMLGVAHTNYGYSQPASFDWRGVLTQWGGIKPITFEYAHAGHLPGDESNVNYHFNTCLGWDPAAGVGLFADGDNAVERSGGTALVRYSESDLAAANVCGMLVGEYQLGGNTMTVPAGWSDDGTTLKGPVPYDFPIVMGFRAFVLANAWDPNDTPVAAAMGAAQVELGNSSLGDGTYQLFKISGQVSWTHARGMFRTWNGQEMAALHHALDVTLAALKAAQSAPPASPPAPTPDPAIVAKAAALDALLALYGVK